MAEEIKVKNDTDDNYAPKPILFAEPVVDYIKDDLADPGEKSRELTGLKQNKRKRNESNPKNRSIVDDDSKALESIETDEKRVVTLERLIPKYFHMACDLCEYKFDSWLSAKDHYSQQHNVSRAYLKCCNNKKFIMRGQILHHVSWHIDPDAFT